MRRRGAQDERGGNAARAARSRLARMAVDISPVVDSIPYRALLSGQIVSLIGTQMRYVALAWQVFQLTGSTLAVGLLGLAEFVPLMLVSIFAGAIADRADRRLVLFWSQLGAIAASLGLLALALMEDVPLGAIYLLTAAAAAMDALDRPARSAMIPALVSDEEIPAALALRQIVFQVSLIVGPALGGILIATFSLPLIYAIDAASFVAALISLSWVPRMKSSLPASQSTLTAIKEGLRYTFRTPLIMSIFFIDLAAMVFGMPRALFPALAEDVFGAGADAAGLLFAAPAVGALLAALTSGWVGHINRQGFAVYVVVGVWGLAITAAGFSTWSFPLTLGFLAVAGGADVLSAVFRGTILQQTTPDALRGRVTAVNQFVVVGGPKLGDVEAGIVARLIGIQGSIIAGGLGCLVGLGIVALRFPALRRYESKAATEAKLEV